MCRGRGEEERGGVGRCGEEGAAGVIYRLSSACLNPFSKDLNLASETSSAVLPEGTGIIFMIITAAISSYLDGEGENIDVLIVDVGTRRGYLP